MRLQQAILQGGSSESVSAGASGWFDRWWQIWVAPPYPGSRGCQEEKCHMPTSSRILCRQRCTDSKSMLASVAPMSSCE